MNIKLLIQRLFTPSIDSTLSTFDKKIEKLNKRVDHNVDEINFNYQQIETLQKRNKSLSKSIIKAENAVTALEAIAGS
jgi:FtsZ-binding cell division protein ZapB